MIGLYIMIVVFGLMLGWTFGTVWEIKDHTHEVTGVQIGTTICLEFGTLHYPHPMDGLDTHIDAAFCGEVVEVEEERFPALSPTTHLAQ